MNEILVGLFLEIVPQRGRIGIAIIQLLFSIPYFDNFDAIEQ